jgi:hypothetical protein
MGSQPPPILAAENVTVGPSQKGFIYTVAGQVAASCQAVGFEGCGDGSSAVTSTQLDSPTSIGVDAAGNLYIADIDYNNYFNNFIQSAYIRVVYAAGAVPPLLNLYLNQNGGSSITPTNGYIYPATGYGANTQYTNCTTAGCGDGGLAANVEFGSSGLGYAQLNITLDDLGNLYIADYNGPAVRKIDTSGYASTIAGIDDPNLATPATCSALSTAPNFSADCLAYDAALTDPTFISFDAQNNLYIADSGIVWEVAPLLAQNLSLPAFDPATVTYGVSPIQLTATSNSTTPITYAITSSTPNGVAKINGSQLSVNAAGSVTVTASQAETNVYLAGTSAPQTLTINPAPLAVTANDLSVVFGKFNPNDPGFTASITGFVNGDTAATPGAYSGAPTFSTTATTISPDGAYPITPSQGSLTSTNYSFPAAYFVAGTLTITGNTTQTINFPAFSPSVVTYGHTPIPLSATASSGGSVTYTVLSGPGTIPKGGSSLTIAGAGTIVVQAIQSGYQQYAASPAVTQTLTVNPASLTVTGPTVTTTYGTVLDPATFPIATIAGFVGTDTESSVLTGSAQYTIVSTKPNAGTYPITVGLGTLTLNSSAAANYTFAAPVNGSLIVNQATQTINFNPVPITQTYGNIVQLTAAATSGLPVTFTTTGPAYFYNGINSYIGLNGVGTVTVTATQAGNSNTTPAPSVTQTLNVGQAPLDITAISVTREQGAPNPTLTYQVGASAAGVTGGFVNNDSDIPSVITGIPVLTTSATQSSTSGTYPIVATQGTLAAPNYYFVYLNGTLTVTPPGSYTITANPSSLTIQRGQIGQATITITPSNLYQGTVTLSCGQLPANVSCTISPATYTFPGNQGASGTSGSENVAQGTITINTATGTIVGALSQEKSNLRLAGVLIPGTIAGLFLLFARKRIAKASAIWSLCAMLALGLGVLSITSCGGSSGLTTAAPGTTTITISGSGTTPSGSGNVMATVPLTVTIQ